VGRAPPELANVTGIDTVVPGEPDPEPTDKVTLWAKSAGNAKRDKRKLFRSIPT